MSVDVDVDVVMDCENCQYGDHDILMRFDTKKPYSYACNICNRTKTLYNYFRPAGLYEHSVCKYWRRLDD